VIKKQHCPNCGYFPFPAKNIKELLINSFPQVLFKIGLYIFFIYCVYIYGAMNPSNQTVIEKYAEISAVK